MINKDYFQRTWWCLFFIASCVDSVKFKDSEGWASWGKELIKRRWQIQGRFKRYTWQDWREKYSVIFNYVNQGIVNLFGQKHSKQLFADMLSLVGRQRLYHLQHNTFFVSVVIIETISGFYLIYLLMPAFDSHLVCIKPFGQNYFHEPTKQQLGMWGKR